MITIEVGELHTSAPAADLPQRGQLRASSGRWRTFEAAAAQRICCSVNPSKKQPPHGRGRGFIMEPMDRTQSRRIIMLIGAGAFCIFDSWWSQIHRSGPGRSGCLCTDRGMQPQDCLTYLKDLTSISFICRNWFMQNCKAKYLSLYLSAPASVAFPTFLRAEFKCIHNDCRWKTQS